MHWRSVYAVAAPGVERVRWLIDRTFKCPSRKQIVVCGYPRGGTSLLYNMLSSSLDGFAFEQFEVTALKNIDRYQNCASKRPLDIFEVARLAEKNRLKKQIFVIACVRDLRDLLTSVHPNAPDRYFCSYETRWSPRGEYPNYRIELSDRGIRAVHQAMVVADGVTGVRLIRARYEDLVEGPDAVQARLAAEMAVTFTRRFSEFHRFSTRHAYVYKGKFRARDESLVRESREVDVSRKGRWRHDEHYDRIREQFTSHPELFDLVREYGYEEDNRWFERYLHPRQTWST